MSDEQQVTLGEVYRLCQRIEEHVEKTNGRVTALEDDVRTVKAYWSTAIVIGGLGLDWAKHKLFGGGA